MKPLDYAILAVIAVWFVLAVRSIWKRRGSCCGCQGCTAEKEKILHSEKKKKEPDCCGCCAQSGKNGNCRCHQTAAILTSGGSYDKFQMEKFVKISWANRMICGIMTSVHNYTKNTHEKENYARIYKRQQKTFSKMFRKRVRGRSREKLKFLRESEEQYGD